MANQEPIGIGSRPDVEAAPTQTAATAAAATPTARTDSVAAPPLQNPSPAKGAGWTPPTQLPVQPQQQMDFDPWSGAQLPGAAGVGPAPTCGTPAIGLGGAERLGNLGTGGSGGGTSGAPGGLGT